MLGRMPFAITLMARLAEGSWKTPAKELLLAWTEHGIDIFPGHWQTEYLSPVKSLDDSLSASSFMQSFSNKDEDENEETAHFLP